MTVSPLRAMAPAASTAAALTCSALPSLTRVTGRPGASRSRAARMSFWSLPMTTAPRRWGRTVRTRSKNWAPLVSPPQIQTPVPCGREVSAASAECGLVALESSTQVMPSASATVTIRWAPGL